MACVCGQDCISFSHFDDLLRLQDVLGAPNLHMNQRVQYYEFDPVPIFPLTNQIEHAESKLQWWIQHFDSGQNRRVWSHRAGGRKRKHDDQE